MIERVPATRGCGVPCYSFTIRLLWQQGRITFRAAGLREEVRTQPLVLRDRWILSVAERRALLGA